MADYSNLIPQIQQIPQTQQNLNPAASAAAQNPFLFLTQGTGGNRNPEETTLSFMELLFGKLQENGEAPTKTKDGKNDAVTAQQMSLLAAQLLTAASPAQNGNPSTETDAPAQEATSAAIAAGGFDMDVNGQSAISGQADGIETPAPWSPEEPQTRPYHTQTGDPPVLAQGETAPADAPAVQAASVGRNIPVTVSERPDAENRTDAKGQEQASQVGVQPMSKTVSLRQAALLSQSGKDGGETGGQEPEKGGPQPKLSAAGEVQNLPLTAVSGETGQTGEAVPVPAEAEAAQTPLTEPAQLMDRLVRSVTLASGEGESRIELSLEPAFMGKLSVTLTADADGGVTARLISADPAVRGLLSAGVEQLKNSLLESGVNLQGIDISGGTAQRQTADGRGDANDRRRESRAGAFAVQGRSSAVYGQDYAVAASPTQRTNLYGTVEFSA